MSGNVCLFKRFSRRGPALHGVLAVAKARQSPCIHPALMLALHVGMRDAEIRRLQWRSIDLVAMLTVGDSKSSAGRGRTIPLNSDIKAALVDHAKLFLKVFGATGPDWYLFPSGRPRPNDRTRRAPRSRRSGGT